MLLRIAPRFSGEVVVYESLIPGGTVSFMIDGEGRALNKSRSLRGARVVPVYSKWWDSPAQGHTGPYITAGTTSTVYQLQTCTGDITDSNPPPPRTSPSEHLGCDSGKHWVYYTYGQISPSKEFLPTFKKKNSATNCVQTIFSISEKI